jgi:hypothetical protein
MGWTKFRISAALTAALLLVAVAAILFLTSHGSLWSPQAVRLPDGRLVRLDAWSFKPTPVPYDLPYHPWVRRLDKLLPNGLKRLLHLPQPVVRSVAMPNFRGEPFLSAAFSIHNPPGASEVSVLRVVVSDDHGQEFDSAVQDANVQGEQNTLYWANEVHAFPRRGRELHLQLKTQTTTLAEITIPNPAPGPHPQWKAEKLPVSIGDPELEFSIVRFRSYQPGAATFTKMGVYPRTECSFRVREKERASSVWRPVSFEIWDATGNHCQNSWCALA